MDRQIFEALEQILPSETLSEIASANGYATSPENELFYPILTKEIPGDWGDHAFVQPADEDEESETPIATPFSIKSESWGKETSENAAWVGDEDEEVDNEIDPVEPAQSDSAPRVTSPNETNPFYDEFILRVLGQEPIRYKFQSNNVSYWYDIVSKTMSWWCRKDLWYLLAPVSISRLEQLLEFYQDVQDILSEKKGAPFLPGELVDSDDVADAVVWYWKMPELCRLVILLVQGIWKEITKKTVELNIAKRWPDLASVIRSSDFYRQFLTKDTIFVETTETSLGHPKISRLKYELERLASVAQWKEAWFLLYVLRVALKDVVARKCEINISNHPGYRRIFHLIRSILWAEIRLLKLCVKNANDTYEAWVLRELLLRFNVSNYSKDSDSLGLRTAFERITDGKIYRKFDKDVKRFAWCEKVSLPIAYKKYLIDNEKLIREAFPNASGELDNEYGIGFLKEDDIECAKKGTATFDAELLSDSSWEYCVTLSYGWNLNVFTEKEMLSKELCVLLRNYSTTASEILKHGENTGWLTPDYVLNIKNRKNELIWTILLDAKFSKYATIFESEVHHITNLRYFEELKKYFSHEQSWKSVPTKMIILYPGDLPYSRDGFLKKLNTYYDKLNNIVAIPLSLGDDKFGNLDRLNAVLQKYVGDIVRRHETCPDRIETMHTG